MKRVLLQPAFVLHRRLYKETSFLVELMTLEHGRVSLIARGVRKAKSLGPGLLQPFIPLLVSFSGQTELMTLTQVEAKGQVRQLYGECLFAGFYINELLMCLVEKWDAHPKLYECYEHTINCLHQNPLKQEILRIFEKQLLEELGYGLLPNSDWASQAIMPDKYYRFVPEQGFVESGLGEDSQTQANIFLGKNLLAYAKCDWQDQESLKDAKRLTRLVLAPLLGAKQINSRQLFMS